jgi:ABC-type lipoprotein release transport system permease subunit
MAETIATSLYAPRMGAMLLTVFGGLPLLLASLGIYGVLAFSIARRTREIGIRVALGANRRTVTTLVLRQGMSLVGLGLAIGLGAGFYLVGAVRVARQTCARQVPSCVDRTVPKTVPKHISEKAVPMRGRWARGAARVAGSRAAGRATG